MRHLVVRALWAAIVPAMALAQTRAISNELPISAATQLRKSLDASTTHAKHLWRDTPSLNEDGTVNAYVEISRGDRRKWEFDMAANQRAIDRMIPDRIGGYPVNYGFVPQTISYDGDPFDVLILGPPIEGGTMVRGAILGLMLMNDEKGYDAKVVVSPVVNGRARHALTDPERERISEYFRHYKEFEPERFSNVPGWGSSADGLALVRMTHAFFTQCRLVSDRPCQVSR
jgi:inorganic pyrophosphatase